MRDTCTRCSGFLTRSKYAPEQPADSPLCVCCWWEENKGVALLNLDELDDLIDYTDEDGLPILLKVLSGQLVDWHGDIGKFVVRDEFLRIEVECRCARCDGFPQTFYAGSGLHSGAWPYIYDAEDNYLGNIRDEEFRCETCQTELAQRKCG